jgi:hypothetical protein
LANVRLMALGWKPKSDLNSYYISTKSCSLAGASARRFRWSIVDDDFVAHELSRPHRWFRHTTRSST